MNNTQEIEHIEQRKIKSYIVRAYRTNDDNYLRVRVYEDSSLYSDSTHAHGVVLHEESIVSEEFDTYLGLVTTRYKLGSGYSKRNIFRLRQLTLLAARKAFPEYEILMGRFGLMSATLKEIETVPASHAFAEHNCLVNCD